MTSPCMLYLFLHLVWRKPGHELRPIFSKREHRCISSSHHGSLSFPENLVISSEEQRGGNQEERWPSSLTTRLLRKKEARGGMNDYDSDDNYKRKFLQASSSALWWLTSDDRLVVVLNIVIQNRNQSLGRRTKKQFFQRCRSPTRKRRMVLPVLARYPQ